MIVNTTTIHQSLKAHEFKQLSRPTMSKAAISQNVKQCNRKKTAALLISEHKTKNNMIEGNQQQPLYYCLLAQNWLI